MNAKSVLIGGLAKNVDIFFRPDKGNLVCLFRGGEAFHLKNLLLSSSA